jgi:hypothetical protein
LAGVVGRNGLNHRHETAFLQRANQGFIHAFDFANETPIRFTEIFFGAHQVAVFAGNGDAGAPFSPRKCAMPLPICPKTISVTRMVFFIGDTQSLHEIRLDAEFLAQRRDFRPAASAPRWGECPRNAAKRCRPITAAFKVSSSIAAPPYLTDDGLAVQILNRGKGFGDDCAAHRGVELGEFP